MYGFAFLFFGINAIQGHPTEYLHMKICESTVFLDRIFYVHPVSTCKIFLHISVSSHVEWECWLRPHSSKLRVKTELTVSCTHHTIICKKAFPGFWLFIFSFFRMSVSNILVVSFRPFYSNFLAYIIVERGRADANTLRDTSLNVCGISFKQRNVVFPSSMTKLFLGPGNRSSAHVFYVFETFLFVYYG